MKNIRKIVAMLCIAVLIAINFSTVSEAASGKMTIGLSSSSVSVGNTISVTVSVSMDAALGACTAMVSYNSAVLEYTGCSGATANGGGGTVKLVWDGNGSSTSASATLTFKAIANGSSSIGASSSDTVDWDGNSVSISAAGVNVTVAAPASNTPTENTPNENTPTENTNNDQNTKVNCNLASLQISPGTLSPKFSSGTTKYTATVEEGIAKIVVSATASDSNASVSVSGANSLKAGANKVTITVTAPTGETKSYVITVTRGGEPEDTEEVTEEETPEITVNIDGKIYTFASSAEGLTVPQDFILTEGKYGENTVIAFQSPNKAFKVVCLFDDSGTNAQYWYMLNEETGSLLPYIEYLANANRYIILTADTSVIPEGFNAIKYDLDGTSVDAYIDDNEDGFILVYAMTVYGEPLFYWYDTEEGTFQRYIERVVEEEVTEEDVEEEQPQEDDTIINMKDIIMYVAIGLAAIFFIMCIVLSIQLKNKSLNGHIDGEDNN